MRLLMLLLLIPCLASAMDPDPLLISLDIDRLEWHDDDDQLLEGEFWWGRDNSRWVFAAEVERKSGEGSEVEYELFNRRPVTAFWDLEFGVKHVDHDGPEQTAFKVGTSGIAPWFVETDLSIYLSDGPAIIETKFEYELLLSSNWELNTHVELIGATGDDQERHLASGMRESEVTINLKSIHRKQIHPYIGYEWHRYLGGTATLRESEGESTRRSAVVLGVSFWF